MNILLVVKASLLLSTTILFSQSIALDEENYSSCSLYGMRDMTKDICEQIARRKTRSITEILQAANKINRFNVIYVKDHPDKELLFPNYHPHSKVVTRDDYPRGGFVEIMYPLSERVFRHHWSLSNLHYTHQDRILDDLSEIEDFIPAESSDRHKKRHKRLHTEVKNIPEALLNSPRFKRHQTSNSHVNYCCRNPNGKVCRKLICGHYEP